MPKKASFEDNLNKLNTMVQSLESGSIPLDDALKDFKQGITLGGKLQKKLDSAEKTLVKVVDNDNQDHTYSKNNGELNTGSSASSAEPNQDSQPSSTDTPPNPFHE